ncbi:MAG TPA: inositol monophosphatase family protein [Actinomycetota bacterium]|nr:inositol monophosphatase family protein [Actinomycetota bacterium]
MDGGAGLTTGADELLELATEAATAAGSILLDRFRGEPTGVRTKSTETDLVSDADTAAERTIVDLVSRRRPRDGWLGEEGSSAVSESGVTWVVDPLDATVNYLFRIPVWCVSVAAVDEAGAVAGVVHDPNRGETFTATRGGGAFRDGAPVAVSRRSDLAHALVATGFSYDAGMRAAQAEVLARVLPRVRDIRRMGSAALDLCSAACGRIDGYYEGLLEPWDRAAGALVVQEAGGVVSDLPGADGHAPGVVAAGPLLHPALAALVGER